MRPEIRALAEDLTKGIDDRRSQAEAIDRWIKRNVRYVSVLLGDGRVVPHDAASVLEYKFGDCKDHVTLMTALLAAKNIASEHVLINLGSAYTLPGTVTPEYFDDPTAVLSSFDVLEQAYDKPVVHACASGAMRARTPNMQPDDHVTTNRTWITIAADGTIRGETLQITTGANATEARATALQMQTIGFEVAAEQMLQTAGSPGTGRFEVGAPLELKEPYVVRGKFELNARMHAPTASWLIPQGMAIQRRPGEFILSLRVAGRKMPFSCFAGHQIEEIEVTVADALVMPLPLKPSALTHRLFSYEAHDTIEGRTLKTRREFVSRVPGQVCAPDLEAEIMGPLKTVAENLTNTRLPFANIESRVAVAAPPDPERMSTLLAN